MTRSLSLLALAALAAGCAPDVKNVELDEFSSCKSFEKYMAKMAKREIAWDWGVRTGGFGGRGFATMENDMAVAAPQEGGDIGGPGGPAAQFSTTNLQEEGVDEDDLMKTDGSYIYSLTGDSLVISRAWPLENAGQVSAIQVDGAPQGLYLVGDRVIVLSSLGGTPVNPVSGESSNEWRSDGPTTLVTLVDISSLSEPLVLRETYVTGEFKESRLVDGELYVISYEDISFGWHDTKSDALKAVKQAELEDYQTLRYDHVRTDGGWQVSMDPACGCTETYASAQEGGTYVTTVSQLSLDDELGAWEAAAVIGRADTVYASPRSVYIGYTIFPDTAFTTGRAPNDTVLHKLSIDGSAADYRATARVPGQMHDQFSLYERDDVLFVATTLTDDWTSGITSLEESGGSFKEVGHVGGLAPQETIFASRFIGDLAYLVTYEVQLGDPLFTVDISDPADMRVAGELHVTGFSDYLHPMDDDHLLSVGMDNGGGDWWDGEWKLAVSLFDVSDLDNPRLEDRLLLDAWGSEAQNEHHAFNYFAPTESLTIPSWPWEEQTALEVVHATPEGLSHNGTILQGQGMIAADDLWCAPIRRSVVMEDTVWAISPAGMTAAKIETPNVIEATITFEGTEACSTQYYWDERGEW